MSLIHERTDAVRATLEQVRAANLTATGNSQKQIDQARHALLDLASKIHLFPEEQFPYLYEHRSGFYRLGEDPEQRNALYVQVSSNHTGNQPHPHPHTTIIVGVKGNEVNNLFEREDDGSTPGRGRLRKVGEVNVEPGVALHIPPHQFHTIHIGGRDTGIHLHFYGISVDTKDHSNVPRFHSPESEEYEIKQRTPELWQIGVQRIGLSEVLAAEVSGQSFAILLVDQTGAKLPDAVSHGLPVNTAEQESVGVGLPEDRATPVVLVGESKPVRVIAQKLARLGYFSSFWFDPDHVAKAAA